MDGRSPIAPRRASHLPSHDCVSKSWGDDRTPAARMTDRRKAIAIFPLLIGSDRFYC
ncbi:hypothetical protein [Nostoc sp.]